MHRLIGVALLAAVVATSALAAPQRPSLRLESNDPLVFRGAGFKPRERVTVTVRDSSVRLVRVARATATGTFRVGFGSVTIDPCELGARAIGSKGTRVVLVGLSERICPIP